MILGKLFLNKFIQESNFKIYYKNSRYWFNINTLKDLNKAKNFLIRKVEFNKMIKLPKFSMQTMYDSETDFNLQMSVERMSKFLIHYEAFKLIKNIEGSIVECGIFKGTSLSGLEF